MFLRRNASRATALAVVVVLFVLARLPTLPEHERAELASHYA
jgi:hypothetical protein